MTEPQNIGGITGQQLRSFVDRIERLNQEHDALKEDIKEVYSELKSTGFDAPTMRKIIAMRKKDPEKLSEEEQLLQLYMSAIGM